MNNGAGQIELVGKAPDFFGLHFDARHAIHHYQRASAAIMRGFGVVDEDIKSGRIDEVDFLFGPLAGGERGGDGQLALNLVVVVIGDCVAFVHARQTVGPARGVKQPSGEAGQGGHVLPLTGLSLSVTG
jgi:hypothetical protein